MAAGAGVIALDSNLLIYAHRRAVPQHQAAQAAIMRAAASGLGWGIPLSCAFEFWSVVTHPRASGGPSSGKQAHRFIESLRRSGAELWAPGATLWDRLARIGVKKRVFGPHVFDLSVALTALECGATEIWTHDATFVGVRGLRVHDPLA